MSVDTRAGAGVRKILQGDNLRALSTLPDAFASVVYVDPPFNTGKVQKRLRVRATSAPDGEGPPRFGGRSYTVQPVAAKGKYKDSFDDFESFLMPRIEASLRCLTKNGSLFVHLDSREVHYIKVALDKLLGRDRFVNEIIWAYDYGGRPKNRWPAKHDTILWYALDPDDYTFNYDEIDRIPYMAPNLVGKERRRSARPRPTCGGTPSSPPAAARDGVPHAEAAGHPEPDREGALPPGDVVLDFFAGSGTAGEAAASNGRGFVLIDDNATAVSVMKRRLKAYEPEFTRVAARSAPAPAPERAELSLA